jgi:transcriptional regulator with XRE-family HTH domain
VSEANEKDGEARHLAADQAIGQRIRALRRERSLSLMELAARTGYSVGYLSQIERGLSSPSLRTMVALGETFSVGLSGLFSSTAVTPAEGSGDVVIRQADRGRMDLWRTGIDKEILTRPDPAFGLALYLMKLAPGGFSGEKFVAHLGEEAGLVLEGTLELQVDNEAWELTEGDSFQFLSMRPHRYRNPSQSSPTQVLWTTYTPPEARGGNGAGAPGSAPGNPPADGDIGSEA